MWLSGFLWTSSLLAAPLVDGVDFVYHNFQSLTEFLEGINQEFPNITHLSSIGKSVEGRDLWVLTLGSVPDRHTLLQPELQYIGNMHGNEVVGREVLIHFIDYVVRQYGHRDDVTSLLDTSRLHVMVSMNPDGFEEALNVGYEGNCSGVLGRWNANGKDLNRNFPDYFQDNPHEIQPETRAVMDWLARVQFTLAANLHGGATAVVYPYDNYFVTPDCASLYCYRGELNYTDCSCYCPEGKICTDRMGPYKNSNYSKSRDDDVFRQVSLTYASLNPTLGDRCDPWSYPPDGVINGASWYVIRGGMQGYAYTMAGCMEVTLEVSCCKFPMASELPDFWEQNRESLIAFMLEGHKGVKGVVSDSRDFEPIRGASVEIVDRDHPIPTTALGEFWRILLPGNYTIKVSASNYTTVIEDFLVTEGNATVLSISLHPNGTWSEETTAPNYPTTTNISTGFEPNSSNRLCARSACGLTMAIILLCTTLQELF